MYWIVALAALLVLAIETAVVAVVVRRKHLDRWLPSYLFGMNACPRLNQPVIRSTPGDQGSEEFPHADTSLEPVSGHQTPWTRFINDEPLHVFIAVCDHYEPDNARPARHVADARVDRWCSEYPALFGQFQDSSGRPPQHTFFFPQDEYFVPDYLDRLRELRDAGFGDVEIHLHHDGDSEDSLRERLEEFRDTLHRRHGLLRHDPRTGRLTYGFIHGNWALCNSRPDGRWCGVNNELSILRDTGCCADFTLPSAPEATQTRIINSIYYASSDRRRPNGHDRGTRATLGVTPPARQLLMVQGPLTLDWEDRRRGIIPRIENGDLLHRRPPTGHRLQQWLRCGVHVAGRPDWCFIKLHTHGCKDGNIDTLLSEETQQFHRDLAGLTARHRHLNYHYVTAWEMVQLIRQAEAGVRTPEISPAAATLEPAL